MFHLRRLRSFDFPPPFQLTCTATGPNRSRENWLRKPISHEFMFVQTNKWVKRCLVPRKVYLQTFPLPTKLDQGWKIKCWWKVYNWIQDISFQDCPNSTVCVVKVQASPYLLGNMAHPRPRGITSWPSFEEISLWHPWWQSWGSQLEPIVVAIDCNERTKINSF